MELLDPYLESKVTTSAPYELHLMVIEGAISSAKQAAQALDEKNHERAHHAMNRSREFVMELITGLDESRATELVTQLKDLFAYVYGNLARADLDHDTHRAKDAIQILEMHRETWKQLIDKLQRERTSIADPNVTSHSATNALPGESECSSRSWTA